ncbi:MAG: 4Fe-4S binding protein [Blautia sp.]|nr:4Fe-4S binding protein [Blautia sp.]
MRDTKDFEYPQIDENKCVRCYQCIKVCPIKAARAQ